MPLKTVLLICFLFIVTYAATVKKGTFNSESDILDFVKKSTFEVISDTFSLDLNDDSIPDKLIGITCGTGGCVYYCFLRNLTNSYNFIGTLSIHRLGFEILKTKHFGLNDILSYWHMNAGEGVLSRIEYNGNEYKLKYHTTVSSELFNLFEPNIKK